LLVCLFFFDLEKTFFLTRIFIEEREAPCKQ